MSSLSGAEFDRFAADYEAELARGLRLTGESRLHFMERRIAWLAQHLPAGFTAPRVLDYGCGIGAAIPYLLQGVAARTITGYDISQASLQMAAQGVLDSRVTLMDRLATEEEYDLVHVNGVFHHILPAERSQAMQQIAHHLTPGGYLAFFENNPLNPLMLYSMSQVEFDRDAQTLTPWASLRLVREAGLQPERLDFLFLFPAWLRGLRPLEPFLRWLPLGAQYLVLARKP